MHNLLVTVMYALACMGVGRLVGFAVFSSVARTDSAGESADRSLVLDFGIGSSILSAVWILAGLAGFLKASLIWAVIVPLAIFCVYSAFPQLRDTTRKLAFPPGPAQISPWILLASASALALFLWFGVLAYTRPPFGDADAFYMTYPKIIAATGVLEPMLFMYRDFSTIGLSGELHFAALMAIAEPPAAKLFAWLAGGFAVLLMIDLTRKLGGGQVAQLLVVIAVLTSTTFTDYLSDGKTELFPALTALTVIRILLDTSPRNIGWKIGTLLGVLTSIAGYAKFSYIICLVPTIALFTLSRFAPWRKLLPQDLRRILLFLGFCIIGAIIGLLPHLLKNGLLFDNPFAPFLGTKENWAAQGSWYSGPDTAWIMLTYPIALVFGQYPLMGGNVSYVWLLALPFVFVMGRERLRAVKPLVMLSISALAGLFVWVALNPSIFAPRYFMANLLFLMPLPMVAVETYLLSHASRSVVMVAFLGLTAVAVVFAPLKPPAGVWTALPAKVMDHISAGGSDCGLAISSYCSNFLQINQAASEGDRVFVLGYYTFFLSAPLLLGINSSDESAAILALDPDKIWQGFYERGFRIVAVQKATHDKYLSILRDAPVPPSLTITEHFTDGDMPTFFIERR